MATEMPKAVILEPRGGLGDALLYSTLPELYATAGYDVFVSNRTITRNPEVSELLYARNPFIQGFTGDEPTAGAVHDVAFFAGARFHRSPISWIELLHGFEPKNLTPKIYYHPRILPEWRDLIFVDTRSHCQLFEADVFDRFIEHLRFPCEAIRVATSPHAGPLGAASMGGHKRYPLRDIFEYCDIIASCKAFASTEAGGQSLAAAIRRTGTFALCTTMTMNSRFFIHPNVTYTVTGRCSPDFLAVDPVRYP